MNNERRKLLDGAIEEINKAKDLLDQVDLSGITDLLASAETVINKAKDEEQESFDELSEGSQQGERGQRMEEIISSLEEAADKINSLIEDISVDLPSDTEFDEAIDYIQQSKE